MLKNIFNTQSLLYIAMFLALAGSVTHLAQAFAEIGNNLYLGYAKAIAIDVGIIALTYSIQQRKAARRGCKMLWGGIALFTAISIFGNFRTATNYVDIATAVVLSATLPVLVLFLAEVISEDKRHTTKQINKISKAKSKMQPESPQLQTNLQPANSKRQLQIAERRRRVLQLHNEGLQPKQIAAQVNVKDVRTIKSDLQAMNVNGVAK